ncbi:hypothetical protein [Nocardioides aquaticus]|nr:hypothetical protein [Nocardioides aquaticus]
MSEDEEAARDSLTTAVESSVERFLDGHLSPEEERHARNIGRMCLEFACLEEEIGELVVSRGGGSPDREAYMERVKTGKGVLSAIAEVATGDLSDLKERYNAFKAERDRYAHASLGAVLQEEQTEDGRRILHLKTDLQKHPRGDRHPSGRVSSLPTDEDTDALIRDMRSLRMRLMNERMRATVERATKNIATQMHEMVSRSLPPMRERMTDMVRRIVP